VAPTSGKLNATTLAYAVVTPVRDEAVNLARLAACLAAQTLRPASWVIVDTGSTDGTQGVVADLAREHRWVRLAEIDGRGLERGAPIVRAFHSVLPALTPLPDVIIKLDADISMDPDHFERLLLEFEGDSRLGIAGGAGYEAREDGVWRRRYGTGPSVWGACRAYRRECLNQILPLEEHMGWDTLDLLKAELRGWDVRVIDELPFRHHRPEGMRDGRRLRTYMMQGRGAYYMGYRISYLAIRTLFRLPRSPAAIGLMFGYAHARVSRSPRCLDAELRAYVRSHQQLRRLPLRAREALRPRAELSEN